MTTLDMSAELPRGRNIDKPRPPEHELAMAWRKNVLRLSRPALAKLLNIGITTIIDYESGRGTPKAMHHYRLMCAAVAVGIEFDWRSLSINLGGATLDMSA